MLGLQLCLDYVLWVRAEPAEEAGDAARDELLEEGRLLLFVGRDSKAQLPQTVLHHLISGELGRIRRDLSEDGWYEAFKDSVSDALLAHDLFQAVDRALVVSVGARLGLKLQAALDELNMRKNKRVNEASKAAAEHGLPSSHFLVWLDSDLTLAELVAGEDDGVDDGKHDKWR